MTCADGQPDDRQNPTLGSLIRERRTGLGLSLQELAARVGCTRSYLSMIETGARGEGAVGPVLLVRLEGTLGLPPGLLTRAAQWSATPPGVRREMAAMQASSQAAASQLRALLNEQNEAGPERAVVRGLDDAFKSGRLHMLVARLEGAGTPNVQVDGGLTDSASPTPPALHSPTRLLPVQVPLINSVAAGYPREFTDLGYPARVADEYVLSPDVDDPDAFAARVVGDSMLPLYREGDIVVFSPVREVKSGMDCFVRLERDAETTFKRVVFEEGGDGGAGMIRLVPLNTAFAERVVGREDVAMLCVAVSVTRKIGG